MTGATTESLADEAINADDVDVAGRVAHRVATHLTRQNDWPTLNGRYLQVAARAKHGAAEHKSQTSPSCHPLGGVYAATARRYWPATPQKDQS